MGLLRQINVGRGQGDDPIAPELQGLSSTVRRTRGAIGQFQLKDGGFPSGRPTDGMDLF